MGQAGQDAPGQVRLQKRAVPPGLSLWIARLCIGLVFFFNIQCAVLFLAHPQAYAPAYELGGVVGGVTIQAIGLLFLMWNVPYAVALWHPARQVISLIEATGMQAIGLAGESLLLSGLPAGHPVLQASIRQFILFDGVGLVALLIALSLALRINLNRYADCFGQKNGPRNDRTTP